MRTHLTLLAALFIGVAAAGATEPPSNGAYTSLTLSSAAACARACADDGICMAWTYRAENACELSAIVAVSPPSGAIASGLAARAPTFALRQLSTPVAAPAVEELPAIPEIEPEQMLGSETDAEAMLLGGPEEGDLRLGFGARR